MNCIKMTGPYWMEAVADEWWWMSLWLNELMWAKISLCCLNKHNSPFRFPSQVFGPFQTFFPVIWQQFNTFAQCQNIPPFHLLINVTTAISPSHTCNPKTFETENIWLKTAKSTDRHTKDFGILVMLFSLMCLVSNTAHTVALSRTASVCLNKVKRTLQWIFLNNTKQPHTLDGICRKRVFSDPDDPVVYLPAIVVFTYTVEYGITWSRLISVQSHISYCNSPALTGFICQIDKFK